MTPTDEAPRDIETEYRTRRQRRTERKHAASLHSCEGKVRHVTKDAASREASRLGLRYGAYPCSNCKGWHVGQAKGRRCDATRTLTSLL